MREESEQQLANQRRFAPAMTPDYCEAPMSLEKNFLCASVSLWLFS
jgi:hypothetical protein